ncbi:hypothetical protein [Archangium lansingense]|uniref:Uncharacterized protein n=1 Tax=Archangium lansingense TaxID=2995310 RepID=A0ABT4AG25_9BACT|nr:hypothetical protein [Archangium lansinium]MCY1080638.1 hypothetical protein [Archangium lansinium]
MDEAPTWRATAVFTRDELEMLISDSRGGPECHQHRIFGFVYRMAEPGYPTPVPGAQVDVDSNTVSALVPGLGRYAFAPR